MPGRSHTIDVLSGRDEGGSIPDHSPHHPTPAPARQGRRPAHAARLGAAAADGNAIRSVEEVDESGRGVQGCRQCQTNRHGAGGGPAAAQAMSSAASSQPRCPLRWGGEAAGRRRHMQRCPQHRCRRGACGVGGGAGGGPARQVRTEDCAAPRRTTPSPCF